MVQVKPDKKWAKSLSLSYSDKSGANLALKAKPAKGIKLVRGPGRVLGVCCVVWVCYGWVGVLWVDGWVCCGWVGGGQLWWWRCSPAGAAGAAAAGG
jgi:hypothetical protein